MWLGGRADADDDLTAAIEQGVDDVIEFLLGTLAVHELEVVDQQHVDGAELLLEGQRILAAEGLDELIAEALGGEIKHLRFGGGVSPPKRWRAEGASCRDQPRSECRED